MFFILSKILMFVIKPLNWVVAFLIAGFILKNPRRKKIAFISALSILVFFSNDFIANQLLKAWEVEPVPIRDLSAYDAGIVLTGVANTEIEPRDRVYFNKGADRVTHAAQLYKEGKIKKIVISGGSGKLIRRSDDIPEADNIVQFYLMTGIPWEDIIVENQSQNTYQSAANCRTLLEKMFPGGRHLVITSAFHQRRSMGCFRKAGVDADAFSCDFHTDRSGEFNVASLLLPSTAAIQKWEIMLKEWAGIAAYRAAGYL